MGWGGAASGAVGGAATGAQIGSIIPGIGTAIGAGIGGLAGGIGGWGQDQAYGNAQGQEQRGWNQARGYQEPYWQHGNDQYDSLNQARQRLMDPAKLQSEWANSYEQSPYAQQMLKQNQANGLDAASQMGLSGSSAALGNIQQGAHNVVNQDRQQYMNDLMQKYMTGIGLGSDIYGKGATAGTNLGGQAMTHGENQANLDYGRGMAPINTFENIVKAGQGYNQYNQGVPKYMQPTPGYGS